MTKGISGTRTKHKPHILTQFHLIPSGKVWRFFLTSKENDQILCGGQDAMRTPRIVLPTNGYDDNGTTTQ